MVLLLVAGAFAMPVKPGVWHTITLSDGTQVRALLCGDEHYSYYLTENGDAYVWDSGRQVYQPMEQRQLSELVAGVKRKLPRRPPRRASGRQHIATSEFLGKKKGLVILVSFPDQAFQASHDKTLYDRILNEAGFAEGSFKGSVRDYFLAQSGGKFELDFDVAGPVMMDSAYAYYGEHGSEVDMRPYAMVEEACEKVDQEVNFADYDWDGDGQVDQVFILYAGKGESDGGSQNTIWPHEYSLDEWGRQELRLDGVKINTYACSNEVNGSSEIEGIGTICHEFSHCMGLPDLYDTFYNGYFGMGQWDILSNGGWNDGGFQPAGYTSYEKMICGWLTPEVLGDEAVDVSSLKPLSMDGGAYIIYNQADSNEYYLLENRQPVGWDASLPGRGLLVLHVDYDKEVWDNNYVNTIVDHRNVKGSDGVYNDHQRLTLIHADNNDDRKYWSAASQVWTKTTQSTDAYPYYGNDSLTNNSVPAASLYNGNSDKHRFMNRAVTSIRQNADSTMSFSYLPVSVRIVSSDTMQTNKPDTTGAIFYESFDECIGTGGNDGVFSGNSQVASADFLPDNGGWQALYAKGAARCVKLGNATHVGIATTPQFELDGQELELTFHAAPWGNDDTVLSLSASGEATLGQTIFNMVKGKWTTFTTKLSGTGATRITFTPGKRFFLDEVVVRHPNAASGISLTGKTEDKVVPVAYFAADGRRTAGPTRGLYLVRMSDGSVHKMIMK